MKRYVIDSVQDIREFFTDLHLRTRKAFSPEDDLSSLVDGNNNAIFSKAEVAYFDDIILDCFVFCNDYHLDLDEIVEGIQQEFSFTRRHEVHVAAQKSVRHRSDMPYCNAL